MASAKIKNMEEFAALSGISRPTISKYFHDPDSVRSSTRTRIEEALAQYDYRPNIFAINQNRKLTKNVGIVVPYLADPFFAEIARNLEQRCIDAGFRPILYSSHGQPDLEVEILDTLRLLKPAGVLLAPLGRASDRRAIEVFCKDVPTVLVDAAIDDLGIAFVGSDNQHFGREIVDYLTRSGQAPCFLEMKTPANPNANRRRQAYLDAMNWIGAVPQVVQIDGEGWNFEQIGRDGGRALLQRQAFATDTVLCSNDRLAIGLLAACYELGIKVGRREGSDLRVAGQDDHPFSEFTSPPLTTIAQDYDAISARAVDVLFRAVEGENPIETKALFKGRLVMRHSA